MKLIRNKGYNKIFYRFNTLPESFITITNPIYLFDEIEQEEFQKFVMNAKDKKNIHGEYYDAIRFKFWEFNVSILRIGNGLYEVLYTIGNENDYVVQGVFIDNWFYIKTMYEWANIDFVEIKSQLRKLLVMTGLFFANSAEVMDALIPWTLNYFDSEEDILKYLNHTINNCNQRYIDRKKKRITEKS